MKVISVNIAKKQDITWQGKTWSTGIFKKEIEQPIFLSKTGLKQDAIMDKKHHGGIDMAVYAFTKEHYSFFQKHFPKVKFYHGIFGENLTLSGFDEKTIQIGDVFNIGDAIIQVSQPRLPCKTLSGVFKSNDIMKLFLNSSFSGSYFRVLKEGNVNKNDLLICKEQAKNSMSIYEIYSLFSSNKSNHKLIDKALTLEHLSNRVKKDILRKLK